MEVMYNKVNKLMVYITYMYVCIHGKLSNFPVPYYTGIDPLELKKYFGPSNEFIKSLSQQYNKPMGIDSSISMLEEAKFLSSCTYGTQTKWGDEVS